MSHRSKSRLVFLWIAIACAVAAAACAINSQPVPPGDVPATDVDGGAFNGGGSDGAKDASTPPNGGDDAGIGAPPDGGVIYFDAGDGGDASDDDGGDAGEDDAGDGGDAT